MEHPLIGSLEDMTIEQLQEKINELNKKLGIAYRTGNGYLCDQLRMALESYRGKVQQKQDELYNNRDSGYDDRIDIS